MRVSSYPSSPFRTVILLTYPSGHNRAIVTASSSGVHAISYISHSSFQVPIRSSHPLSSIPPLSLSLLFRRVGIVCLLLYLQKNAPSG